MEGISFLLAQQNHWRLPSPIVGKDLFSLSGEGKHDGFLGKTGQVVDELIMTPHSSASALAGKFGLSGAQLAAIYKTIQVSDAIQSELLGSDNGDYIRVAKHHFDTRVFEVVFFVGLSCPLRCVFCPSIRRHANGRKTLRHYPNHSGDAITREEIARVFADIRRMQESGIRVLVKLSGGLEPFTGMREMEWILEQARRHTVPTQIFTNGILLNTPKRRALALTADGVRVSISAPNQEIFRELCLDRGKLPELSFELLVDNLRNLIDERNESASATVIGMNSVIGAFNWRWFEKIIELAADIGVDYIDIKPDYYSKDRGWMAKADEKISEIKASLIEGRRKQTRINFAGSINRKNVFHEKMAGTTSVASQCDHKIFITPFGECTPVHYGAFPQEASPHRLENHTYRLGKISGTTGIAELLANVGTLPEIPFDLLNPFERILALESNRREQDQLFGLPREYGPYDTSCKNKPFTLPLSDILADWVPNRRIP